MPHEYTTSNFFFNHQPSVLESRQAIESYHLFSKYPAFNYTRCALFCSGETATEIKYDLSYRDDNGTNYRFACFFRIDKASGSIKTKYLDYMQDSESGFHNEDLLNTIHLKNYDNAIDQLVIRLLNTPDNFVGRGSLNVTPEELKKPISPLAVNYCNIL